MELFLSNDLNSQFLKFLVYYTRLEQSGRINIVNLSKQAIKLNDEGIIKLPSIPSLITEDGQILTTVFSIAQYLANISFTELILIGDNNQTIGEILQVFEASRKLQGIKLVEIFLKHLENRVFFTTNHVTLADIYLYIQTYDTVSGWTDEEKSNKYVHFFRWFKLIQALPQVKQINAQIGGRFEIKLPILNIPPIKQKKQK